MKDYIACYIIDLRTGEKMEFECPDSVSESISASYDMTNIPGRAGSIRGYNNTSDKSFSFNLVLNDDYCPKGIVKTVSFLQSQLYPEYSSVITPPRSLFRIGHLMSVSCVVTACDVTWKKPYRDGHFINADVSLTIETADEIPPSASEINTDTRPSDNTSAYYQAKGKAAAKNKVSSRYVTGVSKNSNGKWEVM